MASGGARPISGPPVDPSSGRSERRGISFRTLNAAGFQGDVPKFPLPPPEVFYVNKDGDRIDDSAVAMERERRELDLWEWAWSTPQAIAWVDEPWRWYSIASWVRAAVVCESGDAKAADKTAMLRLADQIGLTPAGLALNRWAVGVSGGEAGSTSSAPGSRSKKKRSSRDRLPSSVKVVEGGSET